MLTPLLLEHHRREQLHVMMSFPVHQPLHANRPIGGRAGCLHFCKWSPKDAYPSDGKRNRHASACYKCGAYPSEPRGCNRSHATELELLSNDVLFGFFPASRWDGQVRATEDDFDANSELGANPVYELVDPLLKLVSYQRLRENRCMGRDEFRRCGTHVGLCTSFQRFY